MLTRLLARSVATLQYSPASNLARLFATTATQTQPVLEAKAPFGPGAALRIHAQSSTKISVAVGELESIAVEIQSADVARFKVDTGDFGVDVREREGGAAGSSISAWIPERFCSVDVSTQRAPITIQGVTEASLRAYSYGGDVDVGKIRAVEAVVDTGGGTLSGTVTAGEVRINTAGGRLELKRLVGTDVEVLAGSETHIGVCYCDNLSLDTAGGDVRIGHMNCNGPSVVLQSHGGRIAVSGMDGSGSLQSQGGPIEVQITENAKDIQVLSSGGDIAVQVAPALEASFDVSAESGITVSSDIVFTSQEGGKSGHLSGLKVAERPTNAASSSRSIAEVGHVLIDAGSGSVTLTKESWQAAVSARMEARKSAD